MSEELETGVKENQNPAAEDELEGLDHVPVSVVRAIREELKAIKGQSAADKEERERLSQELMIYKAQLYAQQVQSHQSQKPDDPFAGLDDEDVLTVAQLKTLVPKLTPKANPTEMEDRFRDRHADYDEVIRDHLPKLLAKKPHLRQAIQESRNPFALAYELATGSPEYLKKQLEKESSDKSRKAAENASKPGSLSQAGSQSRKNPDYYSGMSDKELEERIAKVKRRR